MKEEIKPGSHATYCGESGVSGIGQRIDLNYGQTGVVYTAMNVRRRTDRQRFFFVADGDQKHKPHVVVRSDFHLFGEDRPASINPRFERDRERMRNEARWAHAMP